MSLFLKHPGKVEWTSDQIRAVSSIARKYGSGKIFTTTREGIYLPEVDLQDEKTAFQVREILASNGLEAGLVKDKGCTSRSALNYNVCIGRPVCPKGLINGKKLTEDIKAVLGKYEKTDSLPGDLRIAISGCPNRCVRAQVNDIGIHGAVKVISDADYCIGCGNCVSTCYSVAMKIGASGAAERDTKRCDDCGYCAKVCPAGGNMLGTFYYALSLGGRLGRNPRPPVFTAEIFSQTDLRAFLELLVGDYCREAKKGERLADWLERLGKEEAIRRYI